jgi:hypothetical protein
VGSALSSGFTNLANELAVAGLGIATLAIVCLGIGLMIGIFDRTGMQHLKDGLLRVIGGSALIGGAGVVASFVVSNFKL